MIVLFEGIDGVGKSTQLNLAKNEFKNAIITKEPGGTKLGERLRDILLGGEFKLAKNAELFLFLADRAQHAKELLSRHKNSLILSDRGAISGIAYAMDSFNLDELISLNRLALGEAMPNAVVFLKASKELLKERLAKRGTSDVIESRGLEYLLQIQENMKTAIKSLNISHIEIDAAKDTQEISKMINKFIKEQL